MPTHRPGTFEARLLTYVRTQTGVRLTIEQLAATLHIDRPTCTRALEDAMKSGLVQVLVHPGAILDLRPTEVTRQRDLARRTTTAVQPESAEPVAEVRRYQRGALLTRAGEQAETVYFIHSGYCRAFLIEAGGDETTAAVLGPGHLVGIAALLGEPSYHAFVEALTEVEGRAVPIGRLREQFARSPDLLDGVLRALGRRLLLVERGLEDSFLPIPARLLAALTRLQDDLDGELPPLTQDHLATLVRARRETISRALGALEAEGLVRREGRRLIVDEPDGSSPDCDRRHRRLATGGLR